MKSQSSIALVLALSAVVGTVVAHVLEGDAGRELYLEESGRSTDEPDTSGIAEALYGPVDVPSLLDQDMVAKDDSNQSLDEHEYLGNEGGKPLEEFCPEEYPVIKEPVDAARCTINGLDKKGLTQEMISEDEFKHRMEDSDRDFLEGATTTYAGADSITETRDPYTVIVDHTPDVDKGKLEDFLDSIEWDAGFILNEGGYLVHFSYQ